MKNIVRGIAGLILGILASSGAYGQTTGAPSLFGNGYGSYYGLPYGGYGQWSGQYRGGYQSLPYGRVYSGVNRPPFVGFYGRYSPSPALPARHGR